MIVPSACYDRGMADPVRRVHFRPTRSHRRCAVAVLSVLLWGALTVPGSHGRSDLPRVMPIATPPSVWSADLSTAILAFGDNADEPSPLLRTLARHPPALVAMAPLARYIRRGAMATAVDQVLMGLRIAWLSRSEAVWVDQVAVAREFGLSDAELAQVAAGPGAGWSPRDATVLRAADELYYDTVLSEASWSTLARRYNAQQLIDLIFTGAEYSMQSMLANSLGVRPAVDTHPSDRWPAGVSRVGPLPRPAAVRLDTARLSPLPRDEWTPRQREAIESDRTGRRETALATLVRHPALYRAYATQAQYIRSDSTLSGRVRELLILRMGWLCEAEYGWGEHVPIGKVEGLSAREVRSIAVGATDPAWKPLEAALLRAVDELFYDDVISDATWTTLAAGFEEAQMIDVLLTAASYRMTAIALNSLGVQPDRGFGRLPNIAR